MFQQILVLALVGVTGCLAITNKDAIDRASKVDPAVLDPEELLHGVIPCTCIDIRLCPGLLYSLKHPISASSVELRHLQRFTCGFKGFTPYVCCNEMARTPMIHENDPVLPGVTSPLSTTPLLYTHDQTLSKDDVNNRAHEISSTFRTDLHTAQDIPANPQTSLGDNIIKSNPPTKDESLLHNKPTNINSKSVHAANDLPSKLPSDTTPLDITLYDSATFTTLTPDVSTGPSSITTKYTAEDRINIPFTSSLPSDRYPPGVSLDNYNPTSSHDHFTTETVQYTHTEVPFTPGPHRNPEDVANEEKFKDNPYKSYESTTSDSSNTPEDNPQPSTFASSPQRAHMTPAINVSAYDPAMDIAEIFGAKSQTNLQPITSTPKTPSVSYDPTNDIREVFGASPSSSTQDHKDVQNTRTESNLPLETNESLEKVQTSGTQFVVTPQYDTSKVTQIPEITVTYNMFVTNIEKKYLDFFDRFYKRNWDSPVVTKVEPNQTPNSILSRVDNSLLQQSDSKDLQQNTLFNTNKDTWDGKHFPSDEYYNYATADEPVLIHRYVRQYNPDFYFDNRFAPHYTTRRLTSSSPNYFTGAPLRTRFPNRRTTIYANIHKAQSSPPKSWLYNDYNPPTAASETESIPSYQQYNNDHHMHNRGAQFNRNIGRPRPRRPGPNNDGSITFPRDEEERKPVRHYNPNYESSFYPGPFFSDQSHGRPYPSNSPRHPGKPNSFYPHQPWGFNSPNHFPGHHDSVPEPEPIPPDNNQPFTDPPKKPSPTPPPVVADTTPITTAAPPPSTTAQTTAASPETTMASAAPSETTLSPGSPDLVAKRQLLPEDVCGVNVEERIVGGRTATLGAYPWIARIGYLRPGSDRVLYRCAGTLINNRYIITAAHCVTNLPGGLVLSTIRLGELDDRTDPDCVNDECADAVQNYSPAGIAVHQVYDKPKFKNDVGMVRLDRPVNFTTYVSPICLPFDSLRNKNYTRLKAIAAGWGASNIGASSATPVLQWVSLTVAPMDQCVATYASRTGVQVGLGQLCAGGEQGRDSCEGDSGGPLMRAEQPDGDSPPRYFLIGIVSFGAKRCGSDNMPGVYTAVTSYLDWVLTNIMP